MKSEKRLIFAAVLAALPGLLGAKCIDYDTRLGALSAPEAGAPANGGGKPCEAPGEARFQVSNYAFKIQCGCAEAEGKVCTVPVGTNIRWQFADTTEHNLASLANSFGGSGDQLSGVFQHKFEAAGTFKYGCSIHPLDMSGYRIEVVAP